jgi:hypothetical protein
VSQPSSTPPKRRRSPPEHGFVIHEAAAAVVRGWADRDVDVLRHGIVRYEGAGAYAATSLFRGLLIEVLLDLGEIATAREELETALAFVERSGEQRHLAELHRLEGERLRRGAAGNASPRGHVQVCFERALALARRQGARLWQLRAAISLADLLLSDGARRHARELLDASVCSLRDDEELPDLRRARALRLDL